MRQAWSTLVRLDHSPLVPEGGCGVEKVSQMAVVRIPGGGLKISCVWRRRVARGGGEAVAWALGYVRIVMGHARTD